MIGLNGIATADNKGDRLLGTARNCMFFCTILMISRG